MTNEKLLTLWKQKLPNVEPTNQELTAFALGVEVGAAAAAQQEPSPTAGMNIAQRILHVGGRNNAAGYVEFGSIQAVEALVSQVLRDLPAPQPSPTAQADPLQPVVALQEIAGMYADDFKPQADSVLEDAARLDWLEADEMNRVFHLGKFWYTRTSYGMPYRKRASLREAIDTARAAQEGK